MNGATITLKKIGQNWCLVSASGFFLHELNIRVQSKEEAYSHAVAWASSWNGVLVKFDDEQNKTRNRVHS